MERNEKKTNFKDLSINQTKGFSVIELVFILLIIGILVSYAAPRFINVKKNMETARARFNLTQIYKAQKAYRIDTVTVGSNVYTSTASYTFDDSTLKTYVDFVDDDGMYSYQINSGDANGFTATATQVDKQGIPTNRNLRIDHTGQITQVGSGW